MRKRRRWPAILGIVLFAAAMLLLLSTLVETPADTDQPVPSAPSVADTVLLPAIPPSFDTVTVQRSAESAYLPYALFLCLAFVLPQLKTGSDANGRVLRKKRYARSFYPVFRQELACG